jgi:hypothetical protein
VQGFIRKYTTYTLVGWIGDIQTAARPRSVEIPSFEANGHFFFFLGDAQNVLSNDIEMVLQTFIETFSFYL